MQIDEFIKKLPKAELNIHLEGCLTPALVLEFAKRNNIKLPYQSEEQLNQIYQFKTLNSFLEIYYLHLQVLVKEQDFYDLTMAYLSKAAEQNVRHAEISFDPQAHLDRGVAFETIINGMHQAMKDAVKQFKITSYPIMCIMRDKSAEDAEKIFDNALEFKDIIVAIGLDSKEIGNPPNKFKKVFTRAREAGFLTTAIAGEVGPPDYIWQTIDELEVSRIDHGVQCMLDPDLIARLTSKQIPLNVCPISNIKLEVFHNMRDHPLKRMYEDGLCVTINSDDPAYFNAYINENFVAVNSALKLNKTILYDLAVNSFCASFLDYDSKQKKLAELENFLKQATKV